MRVLIMIAVFLALRLTEAGATYVYKSAGRRDPFVPLVGVVARRSGTDLASIISIEDASLQGIVLGAGGKRIAIINGELLKEGDKVGNLSIVSVGSGEVTVKLNEKEHKLVLYE